MLAMHPGMAALALSNRPFSSLLPACGPGPALAGGP